ncbi:phospholipase D-like domain-containing protein [Natronobeatus ordinarius]|uniref:phospholipase D-like domain-containing protein n=1 Tax=Natronobeatus ordinarius TaxID=2963433 RepID=UPI0020CD19B9|nr:phospholipase D-like domain-containing protein [Natronobeatus ordinarius]
MSSQHPTIDRTLAIADIAEHDETLLDELEGLLLVAAGRGERLSPAAVARDTRLSREGATDLFRQFLQCDVVQRESYGTDLVETRFRVDATRTRQVLEHARESIRILAAHQERVPTTTVTPLITFPDDPAFSATTAASFGMDGLLSTLASKIKRCDSEIILLSPFFEGEGFGRLADVLLDALERGVELTIVTRYLSDTDSHNYHVIQSFMDRVAEQEVASRVSLVDYTVWDDSIPMEKRTQDGENPRFTLHAKVMLFDSQAAYVGSANVTDYGFDRYLELGVLLEGAKVTPFRELCTFLLDSSGAVRVDI